ncbi:MAG: IS66 family insertion sequence element accessory protein TnpB [Hyphomonas sp.]
MMPMPAGVRVWLATGVTDMRKGWSSLSLLVQEQMKLDPHGGHLFVFRGRQGGLIKVIWHDGQGACLFTKRLERGRFIWPSTTGEPVCLSAAQLGYLLEGIDWRAAQQTWRPQAAG